MSYDMLWPLEVITSFEFGQILAAASLIHLALRGNTDSMERREFARFLMPPPISVNIGW